MTTRRLALEHRTHHRQTLERRRRRVRRVVAAASLEAALAHPGTSGQRHRAAASTGRG